MQTKLKVMKLKPDAIQPGNESSYSIQLRVPHWARMLYPVTLRLH